MQCPALKLFFVKEPGKKTLNKNILRKMEGNGAGGVYAAEKIIQKRIRKVSSHATTLHYTPANIARLFFDDFSNRNKIESLSFVATEIVCCCCCC